MGEPGKLTRYPAPEPPPDPNLIPIPESARFYPDHTHLTIVGFWCERGDGHICATACNSGSVPLYAPVGADAEDVISWVATHGHG